MSTVGYVYEVYDAADRLIYVGAARDVFQRMRQHVTDSWWISQAVKVRATVHPNLAAARAVERQRIKAKMPRWNIVGLADRWTWTPEQYHDYVTARLNGRTVTYWTSQHLRRLRAEYVYRFGCDLPALDGETAGAA